MNSYGDLDVETTGWGSAESDQSCVLSAVGLANLARILEDEKKNRNSNLGAASSHAHD